MKKLLLTLLALATWWFSRVWLDLIAYPIAHRLGIEIHSGAYTLLSLGIAVLIMGLIYLIFKLFRNRSAS